MSSSRASSARPPGRPPVRRLSSALPPVAPEELAALARRVQHEYAGLPGSPCATLARRARDLAETLEALPPKSHAAFLWADDVWQGLTTALLVADRLRRQLQPSVYRSLVVRCLPLTTLTASSQDDHTLRAIAHTCADWLSAFHAINNRNSNKHQRRRRPHNKDGGDDEGNDGGDMVGDDKDDEKDDNDDDEKDDDNNYNNEDVDLPTDSSVTTEFAALPRLHARYVPIHVQVLDRVKTSLLRCAAGESETGGVLCVAGPRGVGKSLLVNAVAHAQEIIDAFYDGVTWVQDGPAATDAEFYRDLFRAASAATDNAGSENLAVAGDIPALAQAAEKNGIQARRCVLILDGVTGPVGKKRLATLVEMLGAHRYGNRTAVILTTNEDPASLCMHQTEVFSLKPLDPLCEEAGAVFDSWADLTHLKSTYDAAARGRIVHACGGLPVALAIAGAALYKSEHAWDHGVAAFDASARGGPLVGCDGELAIGLLLDWITAQRGRQFMSQLALLSSLPPGVWIPVTALACLWKLDTHKTRATVKRFERLGLSTTERRHSFDQGICLHPRIREYSAHLLGNPGAGATGPEPKRTSLHQAIIEEYSIRAGLDHMESTTRCRRWWKLKDDDYVYAHLAWHLHEGGLVQELCHLLCEFRWMSRRLSVSGLCGLRSDYEILLQSSTKLPERQGLLALFEMFSGTQRRLSTETQLASMLCTHLALPMSTNAVEDTVAIRVLRSVNREVKRPWLRPVQQLVGRETNVVQDNGDVLVHFGFVTKIAAKERDSSAFVASVGEDGVVNAWSLKADGYFKPVLELRCEGSCHETGFSAVAISKRERLVSGGVDGCVQVWSLRTGRFVAMIARHSSTVTALATDELRPRAGGTPCMLSVVVSGCTDGSLYVSDMDTLKFVRYFEGHTEEVTAICVLPRQRRVVSASFDGFATIWNIDTDDRVSLNGHKERVTQLCALDHGKRIVSSCHSGHVYAWCSTTGACLWSKEVGYEFVSGPALQRYAVASCWEGGGLHSAGSKLKLCPYFCVRGDDLDELAVVSAIDCKDVMANCVFDSPVTALGEVCSHIAEGKYKLFILVGLQTGQVLSVELVTTFASKSRSEFRLD